MDGLRRFPSFIKCGGRTRPDAELILQKKQGGRATTSLVSPGNKSLLRHSEARRYLTPHYYSLNSLKWPARSRSHYEWVMKQCKNILYTSTITAGHSQHRHDKCASFKYAIIHKVKSPAAPGSFCVLLSVHATASHSAFFFKYKRNVQDGSEIFETK